MKEYYLYILASRKNGTLYTGLTNSLIERVYEHKQNLIPGFTRRYNVHRLVYYERFRDIHSAITREKRIKKWKRQWKINLIESTNPDWEDLYDMINRPYVSIPESKKNINHCHSCAGRNLKSKRLDSATSAE